MFSIHPMATSMVFKWIMNEYTPPYSIDKETISDELLFINRKGNINPVLQVINRR